MNLIPYRPRWVNWLIARLGGYFWLPCPICGDNFGGHEWPLGMALYKNWNRGEGICPKPDCLIECQKRNAELFAKLPPPVLLR